MKKSAEYLGLGLSVLGLVSQVYAFMGGSPFFIFSYWFLLGLVCSVAGLAVYTKSQGKTILWGAVGLVPYIGVLAGLLALAPRGLGLAVLGLTLQACEWYSIGLFRLPFSITMLVSSGITAAGLAWYAYERDRHPAWGLLGLLPVVGPARVLATLTWPANGASGRSSLTIPSRARLAHALLIPPAIVLSYYVGILIVGRVEVAKVSPDGSLRVQVVVVPNTWDYNYFLRMQRIGTFGIAWSEPIYRSVDEPFGARRVVWAKDGSRFVVLGPKYENKRPGRFLDGEKAYLTYDLTSGEIRCFRQTKCRLPPPSLDDLGQIEWAERI